jgi:inward rectifier potassium channel
MRRFKPVPTQNLKHERMVHIGTRNILIRGLKNGFWGDFYHRAHSASWPAFFVGLVLGYAGLNLFFSGLLLLQSGAVANAITVSDHFFFSVHTLATVGYGNMYPATLYGHIITTIEIFIGCLCLAVMTGLIFSRFARPRARFIFAQNMVVAPHNGVENVMVRVVNARTNLMNNATAKLWLSRLETTSEGVSFRRFMQLKLTHDENPLFALSWTLFHPIDEDSPLYGRDKAQLISEEAGFIVTLRGFDEESAQDVLGRKNYEPQQLLFGHAYKDVLGRDEAGQVFFDYTQFNETQIYGTQGL